MGHYRTLWGTIGHYGALLGTMGHYRTLWGTIGHYGWGTIGHTVGSMGIGRYWIGPDGSGSHDSFPRRRQSD